MRSRIAVLVAAVLLALVGQAGSGSVSAASDKPFVPKPQQYEPVRHQVQTHQWSRPSRPETSKALARRGPLPATWSADRPWATISRAGKAGHLRGNFHIKLADKATTVRLGARGLVFAVTADAGSDKRAKFTFDYEDLVASQGVDWVSRLQLGTMPACALTTPDRPACQRLTPLADSVNDPAGRRVSATIDSVAVDSSGANAARRSATTTQAAATVVAAAPGPGGSQGNFTASSLQPSGSWSQGGASGSFSWSYPITATPSAIGQGVAPSLGLSYSSSTVDGMNSNTNPQSSWVGMGFDYQPGYVERTFRNCKEANSSSTDKGLCWAGDILTVHMPGGATEALVVDSSTGAIRPESDNGERVERLTGANNGGLNGEYWRITTTEGTQYTFGKNVLPGGTATANATHSAWNVPVYGGTSSDGCAAKRCTRTWRWNLDMVEDVHHNVAAYYYTNETNYFIPSGTTTRTAYDRGGYLSRIDYGIRNVSNSIYSVANPPNRVNFNVEERCNPTGSITCTDAQFVAANRLNWPDVPVDQSCGSTGTCNINWPTFWTRKRLATITTSYYSGSGTTYTAVDSYALKYVWSQSTSTPALDLYTITRTATAAGNTIKLPPVTLEYATLFSRVQGYKGLPDMGYDRLTRIVSETGSETKVTYNSLDPKYNDAVAPWCTASNVPSNPAQDTMECFPVNWVQPFQTAPTLDYFHKYAVVAVDEIDPNALTPMRHTTYTYAGPGWHADDNEVVKPAQRTYGAWRGYRTVETRTGDTTYTSPNGTTDATTRSKTLYYLGMSDFADSRGDNRTDTDQFAGTAADTQVFNGATEVSDTRTTPRVLATTASRTRSGLPDLKASVVDTIKTVETADGTSAGSTDRVKTTTTSYVAASPNEPFIQRPDTVVVSATGGTGISTGTCTSTNYADNSSTWVRSAPAETSTYATSCPADSITGLVSRTSNYYDLKTALGGSNITNGDATRTESAVDVTGTSVRYATTTAAFDSFGRPTGQTVYPDGAGTVGTARTTTTAYTTSAGGVLTGVTTTRPTMTGITGAVTSTQTLDPARGVPTRSADIAGRIMSATIDGLGRYTAVWKPGRVQGTDSASVTYAYQFAPGSPLAVTSKTLVDAGNGATPSYNTIVVILDSRGVLRQTQADAPGGGRAIADTFVDSHGWTVASNDRWYTTGTPSSAVVTTSNANIDARTTTLYDQVGRASTIKHWKGVDAQPVDTTTTIYGGDRTTILPPSGGVASTSFVNGLGQVTALDRYTVPVTASTFSGAPANRTTYGFDAAGAVVKMSTAVGTAKSATWTSTYDLLGRKVQSDDPDSGSSVMTFDDTGAVTSTTDSAQHKVSTTYDAWGRPTARYAGAAVTGTKLTSWTYDTLVKGELTSSSVYVANQTTGTTQTFTDAVVGYNAMGQPTGTDLTLNVPGLLSKYSTRATYTATGLPATKTLAPTYDSVLAQGNYAEKLTNWYDRLGNQNGLTGTNGYLTGATYTPYREASQYVLGVNDATTAITYTRDPHHRWITNTQFTGQLAQPQVENVAATYDAAGNTTSIVDTQGPTGSPTQTTCYAYDPLQQLTDAWSANDNCAGSPQPNSIGGVNPFWETWTYDAAGSRETQTIHPLPGRSAIAATTSYTNGAAGHAHVLASAATTGSTDPADTGVVSSIAPSLGATYTPNGATDTVTTPSGDTKFGYRADSSLATITAPDGSRSEYVNDSEGAHLLRIDVKAGVTSTTLYLPGQQVTLKDTGTTKSLTTTRYYGLEAGQQIAVRKNNTNPVFTLADPHETAQLTYDPFTNPTNPPVTRRAFDPYGNPLGTGSAAASWIDDRTFLNKPLNPVANLVDAGAREYDPSTGRFTSVDPLLNLADPAQANGYNYGNNNPVGMSDPSGMAAECVKEGTCEYKPNPVGGPPTPTRTKPAVVAAQRRSDAIKVFMDAHDAWRDNFTNGPMDCMPGDGGEKCGQVEAYRQWLHAAASLDRSDRTKLQQAALDEWAQLDTVREDAVADSIISIAATMGVSGIYGGLRAGFAGLVTNGVKGSLTFSRIPLGFASGEAFDSSVAAIRGAAGVADASIGVRGSAATGISYARGVVGSNIGDIDFFIVSDDLYAQGVAAGARARAGALSVGATARYFPKLAQVERSLTSQLGYKSTVRIFSREGFAKVSNGFEVLGK